jgi:hypothetical protein
MITHHSFVDLYIKDQKIFETLFKDTKKLSQLSNKIKKISEDFSRLAYKDSDKLKGDLFEIFGECFFKLLSSDPRIGVYNYQPASPIDDFGVDGFGIGMNNKPLTVQIKFRSDPTVELIEEDIKQFPLQSILNYGVDKDTTDNMLLFTNAKGLHWLTHKKVFNCRVKPMGYEMISTLVDNNFVFWKNLNDMVHQTIKLKFN